MTHKTHVVFSTNAFLLPALGYVYFTNKPLDMDIFNPLMAGVVLGSLLPDIDEPQSYIGKRTMIVSNILKMVFGHRGATHYLIVPLSILIGSIILYQFNTLYGYLVAGVAYGYLFHLFGDMLTISGIRKFFFPFGSSKSYGLLPKKFRFYTNSIKEHLLNVVLTLLLLGQLFLLYKFGGLF